MRTIHSFFPKVTITIRMLYLIYKSYCDCNDDHTKCYAKYLHAVIPFIC